MIGLAYVEMLRAANVLAAFQWYLHRIWPTTMVGELSWLEETVGISYVILKSVVLLFVAAISQENFPLDVRNRTIHNFLRAQPEMLLLATLSIDIHRLRPRLLHILNLKLSFFNLIQLYRTPTLFWWFSAATCKHTANLHKYDLTSQAYTNELSSLLAKTNVTK